jgi:Zn-dependent membrane protease YugP
MAHTIALIGLYGFGAAALCSTIIVVNEFNASKRAKLALVNMGITRPGEEDDAVKSVLLAAGLTYLAAALTAALHFAWYAYLVFGNRRDD